MRDVRLSAASPKPGYSTSAPPTLSFSGASGAGASATAQVQGTITSVTLTNGGSGYVLPQPTITPPTSIGPATTSASFQAVLSADGGTTIYPNPASSGAWRRVPD